MKTEFKISRKQILKLVHGSSIDNLEEWFPEVFSVNNEINKPYKTSSGVLKYFVSKTDAFGFDSDGKWSDYYKYYTLDDTGANKWVEATTEEWESALIEEAKIRGYVKGLLIQDIYNGNLHNPNINVSSNNLDYETIKAGVNKGKMALRDNDGSIIFYDGIWAKIIKSISKEEAEKQLGCKII
jgi:hypothetical protein